MQRILRSLSQLSRLTLNQRKRDANPGKARLFSLKTKATSQFGNAAWFRVGQHRRAGRNHPEGPATGQINEGLQ